MMAVETMLEDGFSLRKALDYSGCSRKMYYHKTIPLMIQPDPLVVEKVREIAFVRPTFGTRRMAAMLRRDLHVPINRKRMRRIFHHFNRIEPSKKKSDIIRSSSRLMKATRPYELWKTDITFVWYLVSELETATIYQSSNLSQTTAPLRRLNLIHGQDLVGVHEKIRGQHTTTHKGVR